MRIEGVGAYLILYCDIFTTRAKLPKSNTVSSSWIGYGSRRGWCTVFGPRKGKIVQKIGICTNGCTITSKG